MPTDESGTGIRGGSRRSPAYAAPAPWTAAPSSPNSPRLLANDVRQCRIPASRRRCSTEAAQAAPGQFFQLLCPQPAGEQPFLRRPDESVRRRSGQQAASSFSTRSRAQARAAWPRFRSGDRLDIMGPLGVGFTLDPAWKHVVAVGRGAGLATLAPLAKAARAKRHPRHGNLQRAAARLARFGRPLRETRRRCHRGDGFANPPADRPTSSALLRRLIAEGRCDAFYTCGSSRLMRVQQRLALEFGLPGQVAMEQQMACGIGPLLLLRPRLQRQWRDRSSPRVLGRAGLRHDGGAAMTRPVGAASAA